MRSKSQQEIVGFILIIVIVTIIGLFVLLLFINNRPQTYNSLNVQNFLKSAMMYTTSCYSNVEPLSIENLIKRCYENDQCADGEPTCSVLNKTLLNLIEQSWIISNESSTNAYFLDISYFESNNQTNPDNLLSLKQGNCTGVKIGSEHPINYGEGDIIITLEVCSQKA